MIKNIRQISQQLANPVFDNPKDLVAWMGAIQGQDYTMSKWAVGIRLKNPSLKAVEEAFNRGEILRTHVMRPTWHLVAAEDIRWMIGLSGKRIRNAWGSIDKEWGVDEKLLNKCNKQLEKILEGKNLTKQEVAIELERAGILRDTSWVNRFTLYAEAEGIICSGADKNKKPTYALLEERVAPCRVLDKDESLAKLATMYFRSHSPASLNDFVWWSGLPITEARRAIVLIEEEIIKDRFDSQDLFIHQSHANDVALGDSLHLLPPYDEYLISYKNRIDVLDAEHHPKAFTNYGIFYPVILYNGKVAGNWKKTVKKKEITIESSFFDKKLKVNKKLLKAAEEKYIKFLYENE